MVDHTPCPPSRGRLLLYGLGYTGELFCRRQLARGWDTQVIVRSAESRGRVEGLGAVAIEASDVANVEAAGATTNALLVVAPPSEGYCPGLKALSPALSRRDTQLRWIGYLSSTAVYGDQQGAWTNEDSPLNTASETGLRRRDAERAWRSSCEQVGLPLVIFRLAGIYGPGRSALERLREGRARRIQRDNHVLSRIHVDDLVALLEASLDRTRQPAVYNVCDDEPASTADVVSYAARLLGVEPPPLEAFDSATLSTAAARYFHESRRISNALARRSLDWQPRFPSYREGLDAIYGATMTEG
jgi:nucleoside-diphosphate-sugar epimerase